MSRWSAFCSAEIRWPWVPRGPNSPLRSYLSCVRVLQRVVFIKSGTDTTHYTQGLVLIRVSMTRKCASSACHYAVAPHAFMCQRSWTRCNHCCPRKLSAATGQRGIRNIRMLHQNIQTMCRTHPASRKLCCSQRPLVWQSLQSIRLLLCVKHTLQIIMRNPH